MKSSLFSNHASTDRHFNERMIVDKRRIINRSHTRHAALRFAGRKSKALTRNELLLRDVFTFFSVALASCLFILVLFAPVLFIHDDLPKLELKLIIFFHSRMNSLKRLLRSIEEADIIQQQVIIEIYFDGCGSKSNPIYQDLLESTWSASRHGPVNIVCRETLLGLKKNILSAWQPEKKNSFAIFLEDDLEVSPFFLEFARDAIVKYGLQDDDDHPGLLGISLFHELFSEITSRAVSCNDPGADFFLYQQGQSWGAVFFPVEWQRFVAFYKTLPESFDPQLPFESSVNDWNCSTSWKKFLLTYMYSHGKYMIFPNLKERYSFSTHHAEPGVHFWVKPSEEDLKNKFMPKLLTNRELYPKTLPDFDNMPIYNMKFDRVLTLEDLRP